MNKITKIGVTALCGSLAAVASAQAGSMTVAGGATATYTSVSGATTGNPLGMATGLTFTGTGEMDNGHTVTVNVTHDDQNAYSTSDIAVDIAGLGTFKLDQGGGTGLDRLDDKMPTAWEESYDTGLGTGIQTVVGAGGSTDIEWAVSTDMLPDGMTAYLSYSPHPDGSKANDKAVGGEAGGAEVVTGDGYDIVIEHSGLADGLNVFAGYSTIDQLSSYGDRTGYALGATYAIGSITIGYQWSQDHVNVPDTQDMYENVAYGISFNVNDDLSISYGHHTSDEDSDSSATGRGVEVEAESIQLAYSMGGATLKFAESSVDNASYSTAASADKDGRTIALSLAF